LLVKRSLDALILFAAVSGTLRAQVSVAPPTFGTVRAGETARIQWQGLPRGVEELELLLSVEGRELPIRVTPQLAAEAGLVLWQVPNLPSRRARLAIRYGLDGEEVESEPGAAFEILPTDGEAPAALEFRQGEWWIQERERDRFPGALKPRDQSDRVREDRETSPCAASRQLAPVPESGASRRSMSKVFAPVAPSVGLVLVRKPVEIPARI
jgi:hypothetical protein